MDRLEQFLCIVGLGFAVWSIVFSVGLGELTLYFPEFPLGQENVFFQFGVILGWVAICLLPGLPLFLALKQIHKRTTRKKRQKRPAQT